METGTSQWYQMLAKPGWTPSGGTIGTIWSVLYPLILIAAVATGLKAFRSELPRIILVPLALNLASNIAFTPIQFGLRNLELATLDIAIVLVTAIWWASSAWLGGARWIALLLVPYIAWVATASVLQVSITMMNR